MIPSKIMKQLQADAELYLMFWDEWTKSEYCFLDDTEIKMMDNIKKKDFTVRINELGRYFREEKRIRRLDEKLQNELHQYKEWIAFSFLMSLVKISKTKGGEAFFYEHINKLDIPQNLKNHLAKMRISTLKELIDKHSDTYLVVSPLFEHIVNFKLSYAKEFNC